MTESTQEPLEPVLAADDAAGLSRSESSGKKTKKAVASIPLGYDFDVLSWKKPDQELAAERAKERLWQGGERSFWRTSVHDFGLMSDGMELYFYILKSLMVLFFVLSLLAVPLLVIATAGNDNLAMSAAYPAAQTLGNVGYDRNSARAEAFCKDQNGDKPCKSMRYIYSLEVWATWVTFVISAYELLSCVCMIAATVFLVMKVNQLSQQIDDDMSTPSDFTVFVRNLPKDTSESALIAHFSMRYALDFEQPEYPIMGLSEFGASLFFGFWFALIFGGLGGAAVGAFLERYVGFLGPLASPFIFLLFIAVFTGIFYASGFAKERLRPTPAMRWEAKEAERQAHRVKMQQARDKAAAKAERKAARRAHVAPEGGGDPGGGKGGCCKKGNKVAPAELVIDDHDEDGLSPTTLCPTPKPVQNCLHNGFPPVLGSWVADLHVVYPNGWIIAIYLNQKALTLKIEDMRSQVLQFKEDTENSKGAHPKKEAKNRKKLAKLMALMHKVHEKVKRGLGDTRRAADVEGCFITFNHEESKKRCLEDYRASAGGWGRYFQPKSLRFMWHSEDPLTGAKLQTLTPIRVDPAPEPSDILWENLTVSDSDRSFRVFMSSGITWTVLLLALLIAVVNSGVQKDVARQTQSTNNCNQLPAVWYGRYFNNSMNVNDLWSPTVEFVRNETLDEEVCKYSETGQYFIVNKEFQTGVQDPLSQQFGSPALDPFRLPPFKPYGLGYTLERPKRMNPEKFEYDLFELDDMMDDAERPLNPLTICDGVCFDPTSLEGTASFPNTTQCAALSCQFGMKGWSAEANYPCFSGRLDYPPNAVANCYCRSLFDSYLASATQLKADDPNYELCNAFFGVLTQSSVTSYIGLASVIVINSLSKPIINFCVALERRASVSEMKSALISKLLSLQFINTAIITLFVNTHYTGTEVELGPVEQYVGTGPYGGFDFGWYASVGAAITSTMFAQVFTPHIGTLQAAWLMKPLGKSMNKNACPTQAKLDAMFEGPEFMIEARAGFSGTALMVTLMYSTGLPLLTVYGFFNFFLSYVVDKYFLITSYNQPPMYSPVVPKVLVNMLPTGVFIHMAIGIYMLSNRKILYGPAITPDAPDQSEEIGETTQSEFLSMILPKVVRLHTLCMFLLFMGYTVLYAFFCLGMLDDFAQGVNHALAYLYAGVCGSKESQLRAQARALDHEEEARPAYTEPYVARLTQGQRNWQVLHPGSGLSEDDRNFGYQLLTGRKNKVERVHQADSDWNGIRRAAGSAKLTWEHIKDSTEYSYDIGLNRLYKEALADIINNNLPNPSRKLRLKAAGALGNYAAEIYQEAYQEPGEELEAKAEIEATEPEPEAYDAAAAEAAALGDAAAAAGFSPELLNQFPDDETEHEHAEEL